ncbi:hypothetical protein FO488_04460 [Geobacter sp. FeAm09]|uniref:cohesin domain-containing protein n=1 Tax=Geobacter sp. FeAm09 TaxID=2597769 RepID=UPI0011EF8105|nr:cohesin domain-containing protein [Geobacter sp. FeAm09]QEM67469.1 hypothetical protein FO488_04460 [Geobacter sp. FeAm09]
MGKIVTRIRAVLMAAGTACLLAACGSGDGGSTAGAPATSHLSIAASGNGVYVIQGTNLSSVAAIELTLRYDTASMSSPTVALGSLASGAMLATNTLTAGTIRIAMVSNRAVSGSGPVATVSFATVTGAGGIAISSYSMINSSGTGPGTPVPSSPPSTGTPIPSDSGGTGSTSTPVPPS